MSKEAQLQWEARWARPVAVAAFVAAVALLAQVVLSQAGLENRPGVEAGPDALLSVDDRPGLFLASAVVQAIGLLLLVPVFLYLFRATLAREAAIPRWFVYLIYVGPVLLALSTLIGAVDRIDLAHQFADRSYSFPGADPQDDPNLRQCPAIRGDLGDACAEELARDNSNGLVFGLGFAGSIAVAFLFVMVPLRARRVGLVSPFMGILGVVAGALLVLPILPVGIVQAFWLGAMGALYLGYWPGGRGPAWESGEAEPWLTAAQKRGPPPDAEREESGPEPEPAALPEDGEEPERERPASRKRKRKRT